MTQTFLVKQLLRFALDSAGYPFLGDMSEESPFVYVNTKEGDRFVLFQRNGEWEIHDTTTGLKGTGYSIVYSTSDMLDAVSHMAALLIKREVRSALNEEMKRLREDKNEANR